MSGANTVKLSKLNPLLGSGIKPSSGSSLLNPSYMSGAAQSTPSPASSANSSIANYPGAPSLSQAAGPPYSGLSANPASATAASVNPVGFFGGPPTGVNPPPVAGVGDSPVNAGPMSLIPWGAGGEAKSFNIPGIKRANDDVPCGVDQQMRRKRRSRWGDDGQHKTVIPGMPTALPGNMDKEQEKAYIIQLQIEDYSRRLRSGVLEIPEDPSRRSPSPEPIYGSDGKRMNTREFRTRRKLEDERHRLIVSMFQLNPEYKPPADYKPPANKISDKLFIPQDDHPEINFIGLIIGPRGNTLKALEKDSGAKIIIRGKGSVKEGKVGRKDGLPMPGEDEPLHALVTSSNPECVKRAIQRIKQIIKEGVEVPEEQNDLRKNQLRELALLNGTLRDGFVIQCQNCGALGHKAWQCPDKPIVTNHIVCTACGGTGHVASDCLQRKMADIPAGDQAAPGAPPHGGRAKIDAEYMSLMAELGEAPPPPPSAPGDELSRHTGQTAFSNRDRSAPLPIMPAPNSSGSFAAPPPMRPPMPPSVQQQPPHPPNSYGAPPPRWNNSGAPGQSAPRPMFTGSGSLMPTPPPSAALASAPGQHPGQWSGGGSGEQWNSGGNQHAGSQPNPVPPPRAMAPSPNFGPPGPPHRPPMGPPARGPAFNGMPPRPGMFPGGQGAPIRPGQPLCPTPGQPPFNNWQQGGRRDLSALAQAGLPNLLAAPPPPPPS